MKNDLPRTITPAYMAFKAAAATLLEKAEAKATPRQTAAPQDFKPERLSRQKAEALQAVYEEVLKLDAAIMNLQGVITANDLPELPFNLLRGTLGGWIGRANIIRKQNIEAVRESGSFKARMALNLAEAKANEEATTTDSRLAA